MWMELTQQSGMIKASACREDVQHDRTQSNPKGTRIFWQPLQWKRSSHISGSLHRPFKVWSFPLLAQQPSSSLFGWEKAKDGLRGAVSYHNLPSNPFFGCLSLQIYAPRRGHLAYTQAFQLLVIGEKFTPFSHLGTTAFSGYSEVLNFLQRIKIKKPI